MAVDTKMNRERRVFSIDVGNLPKVAAEKLINKFVEKVLEEDVKMGIVGKYETYWLMNRQGGSFVDFK